VPTVAGKEKGLLVGRPSAAYRVYFGGLALAGPPKRNWLLKNEELANKDQNAAAAVTVAIHNVLFPQVGKL
jgi:hypothetical protein